MEPYSVVTKTSKDKKKSKERLDTQQLRSLTICQISDLACKCSEKIGGFLAKVQLHPSSKEEFQKLLMEILKPVKSFIYQLDEENKIWVLQWLSNDDKSSLKIEAEHLNSKQTTENTKLCLPK